MYHRTPTDHLIVRRSNVIVPARPSRCAVNASATKAGAKTPSRYRGPLIAISPDRCEMSQRKSAAAAIQRDQLRMYVSAKNLKSGRMIVSVHVGPPNNQVDPAARIQPTSA